MSDLQKVVKRLAKRGLQVMHPLCGKAFLFKKYVISYESCVNPSNSIHKSTNGTSENTVLGVRL